jgi:starch phosphorylase
MTLRIEESRRIGPAVPLQSLPYDTLDPDAERRLLNVLHVITLHNRIRAGRDVGVPRAVIFGGKAAPGYAGAKLIIRLINGAADRVNDPATRGRLAVAFLADYRVSLAEQVVPAAALSEQISAAGTEASGTGNMKLGLNGALTIGTLDGANVEMREEVGDDSIFIFGLTAAEVAARRPHHDPWEAYRRDPELAAVLDMIGDGAFSPGKPDLFRPIVDSLLGGDRFSCSPTTPPTWPAQEQVARADRDEASWTAKSSRNVAGMVKFSSDRTIRQYAEEVWGVSPVAVQ